MKEMFEASVDGEAYDMDRWGQYFKPAGMGQNTGDPQKQSTPKASTDDSYDDEPATKTADVPASKAADTSSTTSDSRAQDILAMIRNRQK